MLVISDVVEDWLSIISRMRTSFAGDSLGAISSWSKSKMVLNGDLVIAMSRELVGDVGKP
jgi:hypothetical protein